MPSHRHQLEDLEVVSPVENSESRARQRSENSFKYSNNFDELELGQAEVGKKEEKGKKVEKQGKKGS